MYYKTVAGTLKDKPKVISKDGGYSDTVTFTVVTSIYAGKSDSDGKNSNVTDFTDCVVYIPKDDKRKQMDVVRNMYKGRNVVVVNGEVTARKWEGKDGEKTSLQVKLNSIYDVWMDRHMDSITALKNRIAELEGTETPGKDDIEDDDNPF